MRHYDSGSARVRNLALSLFLAIVALSLGYRKLSALGFHFDGFPSVGFWFLTVGLALVFAVPLATLLAYFFGRKHELLERWFSAADPGAADLVASVHSELARRIPGGVASARGFTGRVHDRDVSVRASLDPLARWVLEIKVAAPELRISGRIKSAEDVLRLGDELATGAADAARRGDERAAVFQRLADDLRQNADSWRALFRVYRADAVVFDKDRGEWRTRVPYTGPALGVPAEAERIHHVLERLVALAEVCRALLAVRAKVTPGVARCPYCHDDFTGVVATRECAACRTRHHSECLDAYGGCAVFGCTSPRYLADDGGGGRREIRRAEGTSGKSRD